MSQTSASPSPVQSTTFVVLFAISFCHLINDMMQSLLAAIYPNVKETLGLNFTQIGLVTLTFQCTASLLQPVVGLYTDRHPLPYSLPIGMVSTLIGLSLLAQSHTYAILLLAAGLVGLGSSVFHPESSRVARMAAGRRHGLAQSLFQVGGNAGQALGPLLVALIVSTWGQGAIVWFGVMAVLAIAILWNVGSWYKHHGLARMKSAAKAREVPRFAPRRITMIVAVLLVLIFSKQVYLASLSSYYTFYLIHQFGVTVRNAQLLLFLFLSAVAAGTLIGGFMGDKFGRKFVIWFSVLGCVPFTLALPYADLFWTSALTVIIGLILSSAFPAIVVYAQELIPGKVGMVAGLFFGFAFGMAGLGAAALGWLADRTSIDFVYKVCSFLPLLGLFAALLPNLGSADRPRPHKGAQYGAPEDKVEAQSG